MRTESEIRSLIRTWEEIIEEFKSHSTDAKIVEIAAIRVNTLRWILDEEDEKIPQV